MVRRRAAAALVGITAALCLAMTIFTFEKIDSKDGATKELMSSEIISFAPTFPESLAAIVPEQNANIPVIPLNSMLWGDLSGGYERFEEIFKRGLHARYTYKSWNQGFMIWQDISGNKRDGTATGTGFSSGCDTNQNGWDGTVCSVRGNIYSRVTFGPGSIPPTFTICSVSRYNGPSRGRIINGDGNWLHGHWAGYVGVAYYEGWRTPVPSTNTPQYDWVVMCGQNAWPNVFTVNGQRVGNGWGGGSSNINFGINALGCCGVSEASDWAVAEIAVWNRALSSEEMDILAAYYKVHIVFYPSLK